MNRLPLIVIGILISITFFAAGCGATPTEEPITSPEDTQPGGTDVPVEAVPTEQGAEPVVLRIGGLIDADCWNPFTCTAPYFWGNLILEGLVDLGPSSQGCPAVPRLGDSWEVSEDGRTWTILLHEGITFSDGTAVTASTVKEFLEWHSSNPEIAAWFRESSNLESVEVIDDLTLTYTTTVPFLNSPDAIWPIWYILPPHIWAELDPSEFFTFDFEPPIGTGPYVLTEFVPGSYMIFDARDDYYRGKPPIDRVIYILYTNADALISALLVGEIDLTSPYLPPESVIILEKDTNITIEEKYPGDTYELVFNMYKYGTGHPAVRDPAVRLAIDHAINKQQIVDIALLGHGITCPTNWACGPNFGEELNPDLTLTPYDPELANQILDEAGYLDTDNDGIRETAEGQLLEFRLTYATDFPLEFTISQMIADWLTAIGISTNIEAVDWGTWFYYVSNQHDFDLAIDLRTPEIDPAAMDFWLSCWAAEPGPFTFNASGYCNEEMDEQVLEYYFSNDAETRWEYLYEAQRILNHDRPMILLAGPFQIQAYRNDRFEFPLDTCYVNVGMDGPQGLLYAEVK